MNDQVHAMNAIGYLYSAERQAGLSVQTSILTTWIACTTYFIGAATVLLAMTANDNDGKGGSLLWFLAIPVPAIALAAYHLVLFSVTSAHAKSIDILEKELVGFASISIQKRRTEIGAMAETSQTELKNAKKSMIIVSGSAYIIPYLSAAVLTIFCYMQISAKIERMQLWTAILLLAYTAIIVVIIVAVVLQLFKTSRSGDTNS